MKKKKKPGPKPGTGVLPKVPLNCNTCGKEYLVNNYERNERLYCSMDCFRNKKLQDEVTLKCGVCDKEYTTSKSNVQRSQHCSRRCFLLWRKALSSRSIGNKAPEGLLKKIRKKEVVPDSELDSLTLHSEEWFSDYDTFTRRLRKTDY